MRIVSAHLFTHSRVGSCSGSGHAGPLPAAGAQRSRRGRADLVSRGHVAGRARRFRNGLADADAEQRDGMDRAVGLHL